MKTVDAREKVSGIGERYLVTMPYGIGDAVYLGLTAVDQIKKEKPGSEIDILANGLQGQVLADDPRLNVINVPRDLSFTAESRTWYKAIVITRTMSGLIPKLKQQRYTGIFPGNGAFRFLGEVGPLMMPHLSDLRRDYRILREYGDAPASLRTRLIINESFGSHAPMPSASDTTPLYIRDERYTQARTALTIMKDESKATHVIVVAPDTASAVTRPPTKLLASALQSVLDQNPDVMVCILSSYTDTDASRNLHLALSKYSSRVMSLPSEPPQHLLTITALADLADVVITGDTGIMQLALAEKVVVNSDGGRVDGIARNRKNTVAIFGGTNPGLYGHPERMHTVGRGGEMQRRLRPGLFKEGYRPGRRDYFKHVSALELVTQIEAALAS